MAAFTLGIDIHVMTVYFNAFTGMILKQLRFTAHCNMVPDFDAEQKQYNQDHYAQQSNSYKLKYFLHKRITPSGSAVRNTKKPISFICYTISGFLSLRAYVFEKCAHTDSKRLCDPFRIKLIRRIAIQITADLLFGNAGFNRQSTDACHVLFHYIKQYFVEFIFHDWSSLFVF